MRLTPVGFQSIVRYANSYSNGDSRVIGSRFSETIQRHRTSSVDGTLNSLALSGGGAGGAFGAAECAREGRLWTTVDQAIVHGQAGTATGFDKRQAPDPQLTPACPLDPSPIPFESRTTLTSAVVRLEASSK